MAHHHVNGIVQARAFGAEPLAPRAGSSRLAAAQALRYGSDEAAFRVAEHFAVSPMIIQHQLRNVRQDEAGADFLF